jgi:predicted amidophosphoribosyltransferase
MFCPNCGVAIYSAGSFCAKCGKDIAYLTTKQAENVLAEQPEMAQSGGIFPESQGEFNERETRELKEEMIATEEETEKTVTEGTPGAAPQIVKSVSEKVYFCNQCGTAVYPKDNYCYQCGKKTQKQYYCVQEKKRKKIFMVVSLVVLGLVVAGVYYKLTI